MNGEVVWITCDAERWTGAVTTVTSGTPMPSKTEQAIAWLRERKRYCLDQKQPRIVPVVKPTLLDQWLATRKM